MADTRRFKELAEEKARRLTHTLATYRPYAKQMEFHEAGARYRQRLLRAGNQCISPWTLVETDRGEVRSADILGAQGARVVAWDGGQPRTTRTSPWFLRCIEPAFRVILDSGRFFDCSRKHQVLTREGWLSLDQLVSLSSGLRLSHRPEDLLASCVEDAHQRGQQHLIAPSSTHDEPQGSLDAPEHTLCWTHEDAEARTPERIRAYLSTDHSTTAVCADLPLADLFSRFAGPGGVLFSQRTTRSILEVARRLFELRAQLRLDFSVLEHQLTFSDDAAQERDLWVPFEHPDLVGDARIVAILPIGFQPLLDCHVPGPNNYRAAGVYHHNCGKTFAGAAEMAIHLTGLYPDWWKGRRYDRPVVAWAASDTAETTRDNPQRALFGLVGEFGSGAVPGWLCGDKKTAIGVADLFDYVKVKHVSGKFSTLRLKYYAQGRQKWQGPPVDVVWFDEEPPPDIYDEGRARTIATLGMVYTTFTPLLGMTDVVRRFLVEKKEGLCDINMTIEDAEHIPAEERAATIAGFAEHEREARARGVPTLGSGRIYPVAESAITFDAFPYPDHWAQIGGLDFGWDHPTAAVRIRWDRDSDIVYVTDAYRKKEATPVVHAGALRAWGPLSFAWPHDGLQHDKGSGETLKAQYEEQGILMLPDRAQFEDGGNSVEAGTTMILDRMQTGRLKVASHLGEWLEEFRLYHREDGRIVKVGDDLLDATRYGVMMLRFAEVVGRSAANVVSFSRSSRNRATSRVV